MLPVNMMFVPPRLHNKEEKQFVYFLTVTFDMPTSSLFFYVYVWAYLLTKKTHNVLNPHLSRVIMLKQVYYKENKKIYIKS
jgi:hypothetical protein